MKNTVYITASRAMELVFHRCKENPTIFAETFKLIRDNGLEFPLSNGRILLRKQSKQVRYAILIPEVSNEEVEEMESEAKTLAMWDNI